MGKASILVHGIEKLILHFHHFLRLLPGVKSDKRNKHTLIVNPKTAKFLATEIFHLFGYRKKVIKNDFL